MLGDELLTPDELADFLRVGTRTLYNWRGKGTGPAYIKVGGSARYRRSDIEAWLNESVKS